MEKLQDEILLVDMHGRNYGKRSWRRNRRRSWWRYEMTSCGRRLWKEYVQEEVVTEVWEKTV